MTHDGLAKGLPLVPVRGGRFAPLYRSWRYRSGTCHHVGVVAGALRVVLFLEVILVVLAAFPVSGVRRSGVRRSGDRRHVFEAAHLVRHRNGGTDGTSKTHYEATHVCNRNFGRHDVV